LDNSPSRNKSLRNEIFDLRDSHTYYTRPMSPPGSELLDIDRLADGEADVGFSVPVTELPRLRSRLEASGGVVKGSVHFKREGALAVAELTLRGTAVLQCQRCMEKLEAPVETRSRVALIPSEAEAGRVPEDLEPMLAPGGRISIREIVEEELMLFLPIVPSHENSAECTPAGSSTAGEREVPAETQRPFAQLQELLKKR
jgi:uncharacterized protein